MLESFAVSWKVSTEPGQHQPLIAERQANARFFLVSAPSSSPLAMPPTVRIIVGSIKVADLTPFSPKPFPSGLSTITGTTSDVMGYCLSYWPSAYDWGQAAFYFASGPAPKAINSPAVLEQHEASPVPDATRTPHEYLRPLRDDQLTLHVFALISRNHIEASSGFTDYGSIFHESDSGPVRFEGLKKDGTVIFSEGVALVGDAPNSVRGFARLDRQISEDENRQLDAVRLSFRDLSVTRRALPYSPPAGEAIQVDKDTVRFNFDGTRFASVTLRPGTAKYPASSISSNGTRASTGLANITTPDVYVDFEDGLRTIARAVKFHVRGR